MNRRTLLRLMLMSGLSPLVACSRPPQPFSETIAVFGTLVRITLYANNQQHASQAFAAVNARFQQIHTDWHAWEKGGLVSKINDAIAQNATIALPAEVADFIRRNQVLCQQSNGLFDPGIGKLIKLWGFHQNSYEGNTSPDPKAVQALCDQQPSILNLRWDDNTLTCTNTAVALDFGASGKAYALNAATDTLHAAGIQDAMIAIGGDIQVLGHKQDTAWRIGINNPVQPGQAKASVALSNGEAACSSGTYERFYTDLGKKVSHIIHPFTGQPVTHTLHSTVIHTDALIAEVGALTQLICKPVDWPILSQQLNAALSYRIPDNGDDMISPALKARIKSA